MFRPEGARLLPLPVLVVVKCLTAGGLLAAGTYLLGVAVSSGHRGHAMGAFIAGLLRLGALDIRPLLKRLVDQRHAIAEGRGRGRTHRRHGGRGRWAFHRRYHS